MYEATIRIEGLRELEAELIALGTTKAEKVIRDGIRAGARVIQQAVSEAAPMRPVGISGGKLPPGALKTDITVEMKRGSRDGMPYAVIAPGDYTWMVAMWVEYGHRLIRRSNSGSIRLHQKGGGMGVQIGHVPAYPFIRPGFEGSVDESLAIAMDKIVSGIEREAGVKAASNAAALPAGEIDDLEESA